MGGDPPFHHDPLAARAAWCEARPWIRPDGSQSAWSRLWEHDNALWLLQYSVRAPMPTVSVIERADRRSMENEVGWSPPEARELTASRVVEVWVPVYGAARDHGGPLNVRFDLVNDIFQPARPCMRDERHVLRQMIARAEARLVELDALERATVRR